MSYYNTTNQAGDQLKEYQGKAGKQAQTILDYYARLKGNPASPSQCHEVLFDSSTPLTSIRRCISDLTEEGLLEKTETQVKGLYGRPEHLWRARA